MIDYLYDGSFEGLLTCIYANYYREPATGIYVEKDYQSSFLTGSRVVKTDEEKADKVYHAIAEKISHYDLRRLYRAFRASDQGKDTAILEYVKEGFYRGSSVSSLHGDPAVFRIQRIEGKVSNEIHRMKGLVRFSLLGNQVLYSPLEPDHDILEFLGPHFADRFSAETFLIHDLSRKKALVSSGGKWYISEMTVEQIPSQHDEEREYRRLWRNYFQTIAIKERTNPRCQKNFMPVRYWKHLTEMEREV